MWRNVRASNQRETRGGQNIDRLDKWEKIPWCQRGGQKKKKNLGIWYPDRWVAKKQDRYQEKRRFERFSSAGKFKLNKPKSISVGLRRWTKRRVERTHTKALTLFFRTGGMRGMPLEACQVAGSLRLLSAFSISRAGVYLVRPAAAAASTAPKGGGGKNMA